MTQHHIIGSERSGPHVVVRQFKPDRHRRIVFWLATTVQFAAVALFLSIAWGVAVRL